MIKKMLVTGLISLSIATGAAAQEQLINEMNTLTGSLYEIQRGFLTNDKKMALAALDNFEKDVEAYLGNEDAIKKLLPEEVKHKSSIAINSAKMIGKKIKEIRKTLKDKNMTMINRQMRSQKAFIGIQNQCFRCHNLVRDWK